MEIFSGCGINTECGAHSAESRARGENERRMLNEKEKRMTKDEQSSDE